MWVAGHAPFVDVLQCLRPTHVLSLGQAVWNHIAFSVGWQSIASEAAPDPQVREWCAPSGARIHATWVNHPASFGFQAERWRARVDVLLGCQ
jgi:hypothetical protein